MYIKKSKLKYTVMRKQKGKDACSACSKATLKSSLYAWDAKLMGGFKSYHRKLLCGACSLMLEKKLIRERKRSLKPTPESSSVKLNEALDTFFGAHPGIKKWKHQKTKRDKDPQLSLLSTLARAPHIGRKSRKYARYVVMKSGKFNYAVFYTGEYGGGLATPKTFASKQTAKRWVKYHGKTVLF